MQKHDPSIFMTWILNKHYILRDMLHYLAINMAHHPILIMTIKVDPFPKLSSYLRDIECTISNNSVVAIYVAVGLRNDS